MAVHLINDEEMLAPAADATAPVAGAFTQGTIEARAVVFAIGAGTDDSGIGPRRTIAMYEDVDLTILEDTYPREVGIRGSAVASYYADGLQPETDYWPVMKWSDDAGNLVYTVLDKVTTIAEVGGAPAAIGGNPMLAIDDRAEHRALPLELPGKPTISGITQAEAGTSAFEMYMSSALTPIILDHDATPNAGGFQDATWSQVPGTTKPALYVNSTGNLEARDCVSFYLGVTPTDFTGIDTLAVEIYSGGNENETGIFLNLILAVEGSTPGTPDLADFQRFPLSVSKSRQTVIANADISALTDKTLICFIGIESSDGTQCVFYVRSIKSGAGVTGTRDYKVVNRVEYLKEVAGTETVLLQLDSLESDAFTAAAGKKGQVNTLAFSAALPADLEEEDADADGAGNGVTTHYSRLVYGKDVDSDMEDYHLLGTLQRLAGTAARVGTLATVTTAENHLLQTGDSVNISGTPAEWETAQPETVTVTGSKTFTYACTAAGDDGDPDPIPVTALSLTYSDQQLDISLGLTLREARAQIPHDVSVAGAYHRTLLLQKDGRLWFSTVGDITWWSDTNVNEAPDVELGPLESFWVNLQEAGPIQAIVPLGVYTGADYEGDTILLCKRQTILLKGIGWGGIDLGYRVDIGCVGPLAWTKVSEGQIAVLTPEGNIYALDRQLNSSDIGEPIAPELWKLVPR